MQENSGCSQSDPWQDSLTRLVSSSSFWPFFFKGTVMQLSNGEVSVNKDSCSVVFFLRQKSKVLPFFLFFFFSPHICLSIPPVLESPACLYLSCTVYLFLFCAMPLTSKFPCPFNFLFLPHPGPVVLFPPHPSHLPRTKHVACALLLMLAGFTAKVCLSLDMSL